MTNEQILHINKIISSNKNVLNSTHFLKINKAVAYITFIIKEIYDYINIKLNNTTYLCEIKKIRNEILNLKEKNKLIKNKISNSWYLINLKHIYYCYYSCCKTNHR